jgi:hypothetical protein
LVTTAWGSSVDSTLRQSDGNSKGLFDGNILALPVSSMLSSLDGNKGGSSDGTDEGSSDGVTLALSDGNKLGSFNGSLNEHSDDSRDVDLLGPCDGSKLDS